MFVPSRTIRFRVAFRIVLGMVFLSVIAPALAQFEDMTEQFLIEASTQASWFGTGMSSADFNRDGLEDLTFANTSGLVEAFVQLPGGGFEPMHAFPGTGSPQGVAWFDADGDDDLDLLVTRRFGFMELFIRDGDEMLESASTRGIPMSDAWEPRGVAIADYDEDGDLDIYVCMYHDGSTGSSENLLLQNDGTGHFTDVTAVAGVGNGLQHTFQAVWFDYDGDGDLDLWVINDRTIFTNALYANQGDGTFTDVAPQVGADQAIFSMTATVGDPDNDGDFELFCTNVENNPNIYLDRTPNGYMSVGPVVGLDGSRYSWGGCWVDADGDMWSDLMVATYRYPNSLPYDNYFYRNVNGGVQYEDQTSIAWPNEQTQLYCLAACDVNGDLAPDVVGFGNMPFVQVLVNVWDAFSEAGGRLAVQLCGTASNRWAIGAEVRVHAGGVTQMKSVTCGSDFMTQQSWRMFFGVGSAAVVDSIVVSWPSGVEETWFDLAVGSDLRLVEGTSNAQMEIAGTGCHADSTWLVFPFDAPERLLNGVPVDADSLLLESSGVYVAECRWMGGLFSWSDTVDWAPPPPHSLTVEWTSPGCFGEEGVMGWVADPGLSVVFEGETYAGEQTEIGQLGGDLELMTVDSVTGCEQHHAYFLQQPPELQLYLEYTPALCADDSAQLLASGYGGTPGYLVNWNGVNPNNLPEGEVLIGLSDAAGCTLDSLVVVDIPDPLTFAVTVYDEDLGNDASIGLDIAGGTPPIEVLWNNGVAGDTVLTGLTAGLYSWIVQDANGCLITGLQGIVNVGLDEEVAMANWQLWEAESGWAVKRPEGFTAPAWVEVLDFSGRRVFIASVPLLGTMWLPPGSMPEHGIAVIRDEHHIPVFRRVY